MTRLKLCPFCGSVAKLLERDNVNPQGGKQYAVRCTNSNCIYRPDVWRVNRADVVSMWNRRADRKTEPTISKMEQVEDEPQTEEERCREVVRGFMNIVDDMRNPTEEKMESVNKYIESISKPTGVNVFDLMDEPQTERSE